MNERSGENGKKSHGALSPKGKGSFPSRGFSFGGRLRMKMLKQPFFGSDYFLSENTQSHVSQVEFFLTQVDFGILAL